MGKQKYKQTVTRQLKDESRKYFSKHENNITRNRYVNNYFKYIEFCRNQFKCKNKEECSAYIQQYENHLEEKGYSPSTIHNLLAPVCIYHDVPMSDINKPKRITSNYKRGRVGTAKQSANNDMNNLKYRRSVEFQKRVGIRRNELKKLTGDDFMMDDSNHPCVRVKRGKGGKTQLQRILPEDVGFIQSYFADREPDETIFGSKEIAGNNINYHYLRALQAQKAYQYYYCRLKNEEGYREQLKNEIQQRCYLYRKNKKTGKPILIPEKELTGTYRLRGDNKQFALENNLPVKYDRLAVMAVSVFHLSHFRADVTVASYLLVK